MFTFSGLLITFKASHIAHSLSFHPGLFAPYCHVDFVAQSRESQFIASAGNICRHKASIWFEGNGSVNLSHRTIKWRQIKRQILQRHADWQV